MIQLYDETWQYIVRLRHTARRSEFMPFCTIKPLYSFITECHDWYDILDIGCGENNLKLFFKNIVGMDRTNEADIFGWQYDKAWEKLPEYRYGIAVNSLHWNDIEKNIKQALNKCSRMYISLNENQNIDEWKNENRWKKLGNVEYFWHGQKEQTKQDISQYLKNDQIYSKTHLDKLEIDTNVIYNEAVLKDPYFGVIRVVLENK